MVVTKLCYNCSYREVSLTYVSDLAITWKPAGNSLKWSWEGKFENLTASATAGSRVYYQMTNRRRKMFLLGSNNLASLDICYMLIQILTFKTWTNTANCSIQHAWPMPKNKIKELTHIHRSHWENRHLETQMKGKYCLIYSTEWKCEHCACEFSFLLWIDCSTHVGQFIILYSETITGNLLNKWQREEKENHANTCDQNIKWFIYIYISSFYASLIRTAMKE